MGVGFENIVKEEKPYQQDLFANNDEKKQAVEKAILNLSKKHPEIKVQKARTLKAVLMLFLIGAGGVRLEAEEFKNLKDITPLDTPERESPASLFDYELDDKNHVDFTASGLWKAEFQGGLDFTFGNGTTFAASPQLPVFKQEVELSTLLTLNNKWYFQADFADEFTNNTFAFGYKSDNLIRHFRLANRGVTMSRGYSAEYFGNGLQGGNNQAPGASLLLKPQNERWQADFLVRYDMTEVKSATYYGMNKATDITLSPADFIYGVEFRFPEQAADLLAQIDTVYIENANGTLRDERGKKYRVLTRDEFAALTSEGRLFISKDAGGGKNAKGEVPAILVTFTRDSCVEALISAAGSYSSPDTFLGKIQSEFGVKEKYNLEDFSGDTKTTIEGKTALIIQDNGVFSPFLCPGIYSTGKYETDIYVQAGKSGNTISKYKAVSSQDFYTSLYEDFFNEKELFTKIINTNTENSVYPFAEDCPEIYLGLTNKTSLEILSRVYTPIKEIFISKKAASGTVQVYKNGILLPGISYNENTGVVNLNTSISQTDKIVVTWQEETSDFSAGALALGAGYKINLLPGWDADIILTAQQSINQKDNYFYTENQKNSFAALSAGTQFEKNGLKITEKTNVSVLNVNTSKGLLLYSWDELWDNYEQNLKEALYPEKLEKEQPEKNSSVYFSPSDFSSYKFINIELDFSKVKENYSAPLQIILDEDSGTKEKGREALRLVLKDNIAITNAIESETTELHTIQINLENKTISFDNAILSADSYELKINSAVIPSRLMLEDSFTNDIYITKLSYEKARPYGIFKNYLAAEYKKEGTILQIKNFDLVKNLQLNTETTQSSGSFSSSEFFINTKSNAEVTISQIKLGANLSSETDEIIQAGHSIKTDGKLFGVIYAEDTFQNDYSSSESRKQNDFSLDLNKIKIPVQLILKTNAASNPYLEKQDAEVSLDYTQSIKSAQFSLGTKVVAAQKIIPTFQSENNSYAQGWKDISALALSTGNEAASTRDTQYSAYLGGVFPIEKNGFTIKPKLTYELSDNYNVNSPGLLFSDKEQLKFSIPFTGNKKAFSFEISRNGGGTHTPDRGGTYLSDTQKLFDLQNERLWFYTQLPFYELFDTHILENLPQNSSYSTKYEANFRRTLYNSIKDLYIPAAITFAVNREIKTTLPETDLYQFKIVVTNNSINNFGSNSLNKKFLWFRQEEFTSNISAILKLPANDVQNYKLKIQAFSQLLLFISEKSNLTEVFDFSIENTADWNLRDTVTYTRPSQNSLIAELIQRFIPDTHKTSASSNFTLSRKDSLTFEIGQLEKNLFQKYEYEHTASVDFMEYYSLFAGLGTSLLLNQKKADSLNITLNLGAKVEF